MWSTTSSCTAAVDDLLSTCQLSIRSLAAAFSLHCYGVNVECELIQRILVKTSDALRTSNASEITPSPDDIITSSCMSSCTFPRTRVRPILDVPLSSLLLFKSLKIFMSISQ